MELKADQFDITRLNVKNGIGLKFDNRRVIVIKKETGFLFHFKTLDFDDKPNAICEHKRGISMTTIKLSQESSEMIMLILAEMLGFRVIENIDKKNKL